MTPKTSEIREKMLIRKFGSHKKNREKILKLKKYWERSEAKIYKLKKKNDEISKKFKLHENVNTEKIALS